MGRKDSDELLHNEKSYSKKEKDLQLELHDNAENASMENKNINCTDFVCSLGDAAFSSLIVAPLVVGVWRGTWGIMDIHGELFPFAQSYLLGIILHTCFSLIRSHLLARSTGAWSNTYGGAGRWLWERFLSRVYTYIFILACIMHWRGGWGVMDATVEAALPNELDPHRPVLKAFFTLCCYLGSVFLRSSRNLLAPPYFLTLDGKEPTYIFSTRFKKSMSLMV